MFRHPAARGLLFFIIMSILRGRDVTNAAPNHAQLGGVQSLGTTGMRNLHVLSMFITDAELKKVMEGYTNALGVECKYCHVANAPQKDDLAPKLAARRMMKMVADLNASKREYFGPRAKTVPVACSTCHRGTTRAVFGR